MANNSSTDPLESLITPETIQAMTSPNSQDTASADPEQTLRDLQARLEIEKIQVQQVADLMPIIKQVALEILQQGNGLLREMKSVIQEAKDLNELEAQVAKRNILWAKAVQGQLVLKEYPLADGTKTLSAERHAPSASQTKDS